MHSTKTLLVIFAVLLLLLTLLSAFGGSIRQTEEFYPFETYVDGEEPIQGGFETQVSNNPIFQDQTSKQVGESFIEQKLDEETPVAQNMESFYIEPFEEDGKDSNFAPF